MTETEIANMALGEVGGEFITDYASDDNQRAIACRLYYPQARDEALVHIQPGFALRRALLNRLDKAPLGKDFDYAYQLPSDYLRLLSSTFEEDGVDWRIEGQTVLTNDAAPLIVYVARITATGLFTPHFTTALVYNLASYLCFPIRKAREHAFELKQRFMEAAKAASNADSNVGMGLRTFHTSTFGAVRRQV